ncbi:kinase-like domain-containing protein [Xylariaceae sp. FL1651]|nr:kinase-like domain-containing protein [Xylariaceae sp. FL1651]
MVADASIPESVLDSRWEADFQPNPSYPTQILNTQPSGRRLLRQEIWTREKRLGHGGFGVVWLERAHPKNSFSARLRAVKELRFGQTDVRRRECIRELEALVKFSHKKFVNSFVEFYSWFESKEALFIATEYCQHGDLKQYVKDHGHLPELQTQKITDQVLQGIIFMHESKFAHRDLKPANILIKKRPPNDEWHVKICDMGLTRRIDNDMTSTTIKGTPGFIAPERIPGIGASPSDADPFPCDIWCVGEIAFFLLTNGTTFESSWELQNYVGGTLNFPQERLNAVDASRQAVDFIRHLMAVQPSERLSASQADYHAWMTCLDNTSQTRLDMPFDRPLKHSGLTGPVLEHYGESSSTPREDMEASHGKAPELPNYTQEVSTLPSGSWDTITHSVPHLEDVPTNTKYPSSTTHKTTIKEKAQSSTANFVQSQTPCSRSSSPIDANSACSDDVTEPDSSSGSYFERKVPRRQRINDLANEIEANMYPELACIEQSRSAYSKKYVGMMRAAIKYIVTIGGTIGPHPRIYDPVDYEEYEDGLISDIDDEMGEIYESDEEMVDPRFIYDDPYPPGSSYCGSTTQLRGAGEAAAWPPSLADDEHAAKFAELNISVPSGRVKEDADRETTGISGFVATETRQVGGGEAATRYRQPTVEDAEDVGDAKDTE